jgi:hypothetical protein
MEISLLGVDQIVPRSGGQSKSSVELVGLKVYVEPVIMHEEECCGNALSACTDDEVAYLVGG